jgi:nickel-dependent lactate racemase
MTTVHSLELKFGTARLPVSLPESAESLEIQNPPSQTDGERFGADLRRFLRENPLDLSRPAIVLADKTRLCGYPLYLPILLKVLQDQGADPSRITLYIAYGTHPRQSEAESLQTYGEVYRHYRFVHHDCREQQQFETLGMTPSKTPVHRRKDLARASCVITFGAISHHYFAGYGGGRKLLFPGLGYRPAIYHNHGLFLDRAAGRLAVGCRAGRLAGNPLAEDLAAVEAFAPADLAIHGLLDATGQVCDLRLGRGQAHFEDACRRHGRYFEQPLNQRYDMVLASCGGFPKDINFIQSHKALHNAAAFVKEGGTLALLAECREGIGSETFLPWFQQGGWRAAFDALKENYVGNGGTALAMMAKTRRIRIHLVTRLGAEQLETIGCTALGLPELQHRLDRQGGSLAVIPNASMLVGVLPEKGN